MANRLHCTLALALLLASTAGCTSTNQPIAHQQQSPLEKFTAGVKSGTDKMIAAVSPKSTSKPMPMSSPSGKPGPAVFVAAAQMHESAGNFAEAETNFRKALDLDPDYVDALVGFARLEDRQGNFQAATRFYARAIKKHPKNASVRNDLGLCYHRRGMLAESTRELKKAVELEGDSKLYRNNLAAVYVEQGKNAEALEQLTAAHGKSVGHYNLGYLLTQKQDSAGALEQFRLAAAADPQLTAAQQWIAKLSAPTSTYASYAGGGTPAGAAAPANAAYVAQQQQVQQPGQPARYAPPQSPRAAPGVPQRGTDPLPPMPR